MKNQEKSSILLSLSAWGLSLLTVLFSTILVLIMNYIFSKFQVFDTETSESVIYLFWGILIANACLFICLKFPNSFWYVPFLCNLIGILSALFEPDFWTTQMWVLVSFGWALSFIETLIGTIVGRRNTMHHEIKKQNTPSFQ